jgi:hypothetical protein
MRQNQNQRREHIGTGEENQMNLHTAVKQQKVNTFTTKYTTRKT